MTTSSFESITSTRDSARLSGALQSGAAERYSTAGNYADGANIAGFLRVAQSMMQQGVV